MTLSQETVGSVVVFNVAGRIDAASAPELDRALQTAIKEKKTQLVVDMTGTEFLSSAGLRALLSARQSLRDKRGDLRLSGLSEFINDGLKLVGFDKLFKIYPTRDAAIASFKNQ